MAKNNPSFCEIDDTDRSILTALLLDARKPFSQIAEEIGVSGGTVHLRVDKLREAGVIRGYHVELDSAALGYGVEVFIGIILHNASDYEKVLEKLKKKEELLEAYHLTGVFNIFIRVLTKSITDLEQFLSSLHSIKEIQSTNTTLILDAPIKRPLTLAA